MTQPKSIEQRLLEGEPNIARISKLNPTPEGKPSKPRNLGTHGSKLWDNTVSILIEQGIATTLDQPALESMCYWWNLYKDSQTTVSRLVDYGTMEASRAINVTSKAYDNWRRVAQQFGLTAQARNNVTISAEDNEADEFFA